MLSRVPRLSTAVCISWRKSLRIRDAVSWPMTSANAQRTRKVRPADSSASRQRSVSACSSDLIERATPVGDLWRLQGSTSCAQHVAGAADGVQQPRLAAALELAAQVGHEDLDRVGRRERVVAPDVLEQPLARHDDALVAHQVLQQLELALGQLDDALAAGTLVRGGVQRQVGYAQRARAARRAPPQQRAQPREQLLALER